MKTHRRTHTSTRTSEKTEYRDRHINTLFRQMTPARTNLSSQEIITISAVISESKASASELVSDERARRIIHSGLRGIWPKNRNTLRLAQWLVESYREAIASGSVSTVSNFVRHILPDLESPELFISPRTAARRITYILATPALA